MCSPLHLSVCPSLCVPPVSPFVFSKWVSKLSCCVVTYTREGVESLSGREINASTLIVWPEGGYRWMPLNLTSIKCLILKPLDAQPNRSTSDFQCCDNFYLYFKTQSSAAPVIPVCWLRIKRRQSETTFPIKWMGKWSDVIILCYHINLISVNV